MTLLAHFFIAAMVFVLIDAIWIAGIANEFYKDQLHGLLSSSPRYLPAVIFYLIYISVLLYFVVEPALAGENWRWLLPHAAVLGFAMYATYDLTNAATLKKWSLKLTIVDMLWGTFLTTAVAAATYGLFM